MTRINTNVPSLVAQNRLQSSNNDLQEALTRLSTGLRINKGSDDPAGLIASEALRSEITSLNKAVSNTERANQIIATADSALGQVSSLLNDVRGLVVEAANSGALSPDEIAANQLQVDSSLEAINRIAQTTTFQGRKLLDGGLDFLTKGTSNFSKIQNLNIDQANLGSLGNISVDVNVTSAATKAEVTVPNVPASGAGTGTITLENRTADAEAVSANIVTSGGGAGAFTIGAKDGASLDGLAGNDITVDVVSGTTTDLTQAVSATYVTSGATAGDFNVTAKVGGVYDGFAGNVATVAIASGSTATAQAASADQTVNGVTDAFTISAKAGGSEDGTLGNAVTVNVTSGATAGAAAVATYVGGTNTLTITTDNASSRTLDEIKAALDADVNFQNDFEFNIGGANGNELVASDGTDDIAGITLSGGTNVAATAALVGDALTITVNQNAEQSLANIQAALAADSNFDAFEFNIGVAGLFDDDGTDNQGAAALTGGTTQAAEASFADGKLTITVDSSQDRSLADIKAALDVDANFANFDFTIGSGTNFASLTGADDAADVALTGGTDAVLEDVITITTPQGAAFNGTITIDSSADTGGAVSASVDSDNNITIAVDDNQNTTLASIVSAIESDLGGYSAEVSSTAGDGTFTVATDTIVTAAVADASSGGIAEAVVFELGGQGGSEVFNISAGTTIDQLVAQINLVKESTGVEATSDSGTLTLNSTGYGSKAVVDVRIIEEEAGGTFTAALDSGARAVGSDVIAKVNGVDASGDGNTLRINTGTLDMNVSVEADFSGNIEFDITGGGALFQLGSQVVANQQARIGIGSVNTAQLGGVSGKLFELGEGGSAALATDPTSASAIVDEAIDQVTGLRGRLGAFQRTTIESNLVSLNDTVANLQEAESSIRDADFAAESARLTRAQILVQSGTSVLALANQNPQNVLSLLG